MDSKMSVRLKALRKSYSMSTNDVLKILKKSNYDYSEQSLYKWEQGAAEPPIDVLKALSDIYKCNVSYLLDGGCYKHLRLTPKENNFLKSYRTDFFLRSICTQIIKRISRN